jgi:hypothetical protein
MDAKKRKLLAALDRVLHTEVGQRQKRDSFQPGEASTASVGSGRLFSTSSPTLSSPIPIFTANHANNLLPQKGTKFTKTKTSLADLRRADSIHHQCHNSSRTPRTENSKLSLTFLAAKRMPHLPKVRLRHRLAYPERLGLAVRAPVSPKNNIH